MSGVGHIYQLIPFNTAWTPVESVPLVFEVQSLPPIGGTTTSATTSLNEVGTAASGARVTWNANGTLTIYDNSDTPINTVTNWYVINCGDVIGMAWLIDPDPTNNTIYVFRNGVQLAALTIPNGTFDNSIPYVQSGDNIHRDDPS